MRTIRRGDRGAAVAEIRAVLHNLELLPAWSPAAGYTEAEFDEQTELAVRAFQQSRGLSADGRVGEETWRTLDAARWRLGSRTLYQSVPSPLIGDDVRQLQERLLEMGYDVGRADGIYGPQTARAVATFQREVGLVPDGTCGPQTMHALRRLGRKVTGGAPLALREITKLHGSGRALVGKTIMIDPGHGGPDLGATVPEGLLRWTEADLAFDLALRLEGRLAAGGTRGGRLPHLAGGSRQAGGSALPGPRRRGRHGGRAADVLPGRGRRTDRLDRRLHDPRVARYYGLIPWIEPLRVAGRTGRSR